MIKGISMSAAAIALVAGCASSEPPQTPPGKKADFVRAADVLVAAQCELNAAAGRQGAAIRFRKAELVMTLTIERTEATGGGVTLTVPIASTEIQLARSRTPKGAALRKMDFQITHTLGTPGQCPTKEHPVTESGVRLVEGGLGLREWLAEADELVRKSGQVPTELNYQMVFSVSVSSDLVPVFSRPLDEVDGEFSARDTDAREVRHRVTVTIIPDTKTGRGASDAQRRGAAQRFLDRISG